jgi:hypothetical protein
MDLRCTIRAAGNLALLTGFVACSPAPGARSSRVTDEPSYVDDDLVPSEPGYIQEDSGANLPEEAYDGSTRRSDGGLPGAFSERCTGRLGPGDLEIVELMIAAKAGSDDSGEWVEVRNPRGCTVALQGIVIESPRGSAAPGSPVAVDRVEIKADLELRPGASLLVGNRADAARDAKLSGNVVFFGVNDVLKNEGDTVRVLLGESLLDAITYPRTSIPIGTSLSFPSNCDPTKRLDYTLWKPSVRSYANGMRGTPGLPNNDVRCL